GEKDCRSQCTPHSASDPMRQYRRTVHKLPVVTQIKPARHTRRPHTTMRATIAVLFVALGGIPLAVQPPAGKIDFGRDVQPILQGRCVSCHGPELQMNGLRLDRRADAMRGGSQSDIGPGNAEGSRLYHRLIGATFGQQMPPTGSLGAGQIETIKQWIDEGAEWPADAAGEPALPPP